MRAWRGLSHGKRTRTDIIPSASWPPWAAFPLHAPARHSTPISAPTCPLPGLLTVLAVASPFLFCFTQDPMSNFWPLLFSWGCAALLVLQALVSRHRSSVGLRWPSKRIAALHRLPIQLGMGKRCALRCAPMAARSLRHLIRDATLARRPAVATPEARPEA